MFVLQLETALQNAKAQLNAEMLQRVDAQNQVQTLKEQMDFQKHISEQVFRFFFVFWMTSGILCCILVP